jgi:hypothetical protein
MKSGRKGTHRRSTGDPDVCVSANATIFEIRGKGCPHFNADRKAADCRVQTPTLVPATTGRRWIDVNSCTTYAELTSMGSCLPFHRFVRFPFVNHTSRSKTRLSCPIRPIIISGYHLSMTIVTFIPNHSNATPPQIAPIPIPIPIPSPFTQLAPNRAPLAASQAQARDRGRETYTH